MKLLRLRVYKLVLLFFAVFLFLFTLAVTHVSAESLIWAPTHQINTVSYGSGPVYSGAEEFWDGVDGHVYELRFHISGNFSDGDSILTEICSYLVGSACFQLEDHSYNTSGDYTFQWTQDNAHKYNTWGVWGSCDNSTGCTVSNVGVYDLTGGPTPTPTPSTIDWPVFQHDPEHSGFNSLEDTLTPPLTQAWTINPDGSSISLNSMVVSEGTLYARSDNGVVYAIDISSGSIKWQAQGQVGSGNLAVSNDTVYSSNWCQYCTVDAFDIATGEKKWSTAPLSYGAFGINVVGNIVYIGATANHVMALDASTGQTIWDRRFNDAIFDVPAVSNGRLYFADYQVDGYLFSLDAMTGTTIWHTLFQSVAGFSSPTVHGNTVYMGLSTSDNVEAYDVNAGVRTWNSSSIAPSLSDSTSFAYNSIFTKTGSRSNGAIVARIDPTRPSYPGSNIIWLFNDSVPKEPVFIEPPVVVANGVVYEAAADGTVNALNAETGTLIWSFNFTTSIQSMIVADHMLFVGLDNGSIYAFSANQPPTVNQITSSTINEGETYIANSSYTDPSSVSWTATVDYGDGSGVQPLTLSGNNFSLNHIYKDNGIYTVIVSITDNQGANGTATAIITVNNVNPTVGGININPSAPTSVNTSTSASASFSDLGALDTHTATWNWGDGNITNGVVTESNGSGSVTGSHAYTSAGVYTLTITVTDNNSATATKEYKYIVIYDPSAGFVTGGGQVSSSLFGISAKYTPNSQTPVGKVGYTFSNGSMVLASTQIDWLVVNGNMAILTGSGTINGTGNYYFLVSVIDGSTDKLRIRISDTLGNLIYDNQPGDPETSPPTISISAGQIKIH